MDTIDTATLQSLPLFDGLSAAETERITTLLHRRAFPTGTAIVSEAQPGEAIYFVLTGAVKVVTTQADGSTVILALLGAGAMVGELSLLDHGERSATAITLEASTVLWMHRAAFQECFDTMPVIARNVARLLSARLRLANSHIQSLATQDVFGRVARQLLVFADTFGAPAPDGGRRIAVPLTQGDLAELVGASRVRVNQVLVYYREQGYLSIDARHHITIHAADALARRCQ